MHQTFAGGGNTGAELLNICFLLINTEVMGVDLSLNRLILSRLQRVHKQRLLRLTRHGLRSYLIAILSSCIASLDATPGSKAHLGSAPHALSLTHLIVGFSQLFEHVALLFDYVQLLRLNLLSLN